MVAPFLQKRDRGSERSCDLPMVTQLVGWGMAALPIESSDSRAPLAWPAWLLVCLEPSMQGKAGAGSTLYTPRPPHRRLLALSLVSENQG